MEASQQIEKYFERIELETKRTYQIAQEAREKNLDPEEKVDIPLAKDMAERVVGLVSSVAPKLMCSGMTGRIKELEKEFGQLDWRVGLKIAEEVAKEKFCSFDSKQDAMEAGIRVGFAYLTLGIVSAPLEGFVGLKIKKRRDGGEYFSIHYAGPVRGAGGTAAATSVILADYIRVVMGYQPFDPTEEEINRYVTEIRDYHERVTNLQYFPSEDELQFLVAHVPVEVNGDPTEKFDVSNYKDLPRVETNRIRGGICLVLAEGVAQKAPKLWKRLGKWGKDLGLNWGFLQEFLELQKSIKAREKEKKESEGITPNYTFISDLVAGRPVLTHPLRNGGFRLRYGRTRTTGFSATGLHPSTLFVLDKYIAIGTQLKIERPGKATAITVCDSIEGPIVRLKNGAVMKLDHRTEPREVLDEIEEILYLGDILISYGDFSENGHKLVPAGYCEEWWLKELEKAMVESFGNLDLEKLSDLLGEEKEILEKLWDWKKKPAWKVVKNLSQTMKIPLHPAYTFFWATVSLEDLKKLLDWMVNSEIRKEGAEIKKIVLPWKDFTDAKRVLELIGVPHLTSSNEYVVVEKETAKALYDILRLGQTEKIKETIEKSKNVLEAVSSLSGLEVRDKAGTFIGGRMGRPEKSKMRKLAGSPQVLFPVGQEGDRLRSFQAALEAGKIYADFPLFFCGHCKKKTIYPSCQDCGKKSNPMYYCKLCGETEKKTCQHGENGQFKKYELDIGYYFNFALAKLNMATYPDLIKGVRGTSNKDHVIENLIKGILRAKNEIYVNKDGTTRYDMTELPLTHFKPKDVGTSISKLKEMGYEKDIEGKDLVNEEQILEIKPQDIILPGESFLDESAKQVLFKVARFIDELLVEFYGLEPYYNLNSEDDLAGHLVVGLAPHISAGLIGRIIGFSSAQGCYAHPLWHAGLRRDCDGDENCVMLLMDCLLNFSRQFLPDTRGTRTMDSPLVLTSRLIPSEVDDQAHGLDIVWEYPLELYEAALDYKYPWDIAIGQLKNHLGTEKQYEKMGFTHQTTDINLGVRCSAYKTIPTMEDKLKGQMALAQRIRAVETEDVAKLVIEKHFLKDIKGNLRKFSMQQFRCVKCNQKFRRPPLAGICPCGGKILFTISEGSIIKYLEPSLSLARQFDVGPYLRQTLELLKDRVEGLFGKEKERQERLGAWFG